jgi:ribosome-associated protein
MDDPMRVTRDVAIPLREIVVRASRSSGPGGQHANVTASRVEATFDAAASPSLTDAQRARVLARCGPVVRAVAQDERSQARNRELALERLRDRLERALHVPRARRPTAPTRSSRVRREQAKRRQAERKRDRRRPAGDE